CERPGPTAGPPPPRAEERPDPCDYHAGPPARRTPRWSSGYRNDILAPGPGETRRRGDSEPRFPVGAGHGSLCRRHLRPGDPGRGRLLRFHRPPHSLHVKRNRNVVLGGALLSIIVLSALAAPLISPFDPIKTNQRLSLERPSLEHPMGTDRFGRDIFSRVVW